MTATSSLDQNQAIYITEEARENFFKKVSANSSNSDYFFSAEYLEKICLGKTYLSEAAYSHIKALLRKEYKTWLNNR